MRRTTCHRTSDGRRTSRPRTTAPSGPPPFFSRSVFTLQVFTLPVFFLPLFLVPVLLAPATSHAHEFAATDVLDAGQPVYGLVWADLEGDESPECACLRADGSVLLCAPGLEWSSRLIHAGGDSALGAWDRPTIDAGDVQQVHPGNELVVFSEYKLYVLHRASPEEWVPEVVYDHTGYVGNCWGARAGDYDPSHAGSEVFSIIEGVLDCSVGLVHAHSGGVWSDSLVYSAQVGMDSEAGEFDHDHLGPEIILPTEMGYTYEIRPPVRKLGMQRRDHRDLWPAWVIWIDMYHSGWVVEIGDVDVEHFGNEVVYGTRYSNSVLVSAYDGAGQHPYEVVFTGTTIEEPRTMWDIALGDFLPDLPGHEIAGVDQSGNVYLVWREGGEWHGETIWTDPESPLYAVAACDVEEACPGDEILVAGESGRLTVLRRLPTGAPQPGAVDGPRLALTSNPVRGDAVFAVRLPDAGRARLSVFDVSGRRVATPLDAELPAGESSVRWSGADESGRLLPSGVYLVRLDASSGRASAKLVLTR